MDLSDEGKDLLVLCDRMAQGVSAAIRNLVGQPASGDVLYMGADGTPTKAIDRAAEDAALEPLRDYGCGFRVLSEEMGEAVIGGDPKYYLQLDPLDGTFNAIRGIPFYSLSIFIGSDHLLLACVYDLARGVRFFAEHGHGAYRQDGGRHIPMRVSPKSNLRDFSISAYIKRPNASRLVALGDCVRRVRTLGSASLELCYVADGRLDGFVDLRGSLRVVDVAAGVLLVEEAKGRVTDCHGRPIQLRMDMWQRTGLVASNNTRHHELLSLAAAGYGGGIN
ncbi:MAG: Inositol-1-monophosphatase [Methanosaeta sp. PtaB.Bin039]|nr:MAG: Inositol-1-monophosphatase [Methanosaeta sp. PtaB.Bin039]OPY45323.1 MAG: Inositol-1-monophosphatase [Methanosaeta sp. PtaU1.Bin028]HOT06939.1 bifunctional fructose-bisphosphatase/inositol-phosphate phosphatase [Methanotrichaceae archaeon]HQF17750.1 bifunctional fructose-bisphosphatase/inositol-phosphate phosphatase [Methanotrichaceae archaeon]HQI91575.1 bifunctional fructose-bisphosphatase/inositol-phosphate phosphatase [Methanotrichaceae archaeon]